MSRSFSGNQGTVAIPGGKSFQITKWSFTVTTGMLKEWFGSFTATTATTIALSQATGPFAIEFEDETGGRWTGEIITRSHAITGRPTRLPFNGAGKLERNGELFR
jgi:hypothetical protein